MLPPTCSSSQELREQTKRLCPVRRATPLSRQPSPNSQVSEPQFESNVKNIGSLQGKIIDGKNKRGSALQSVQIFLPDVTLSQLLRFDVRDVAFLKIRIRNRLPNYFESEFLCDSFRSFRADKEDFTSIRLL